MQKRGGEDAGRRTTAGVGAGYHAGGLGGRGEGGHGAGILEGLARPLTASALHSYLKRLEEKGFLSCRKEGRTNRYVPRVSRAEYQSREGRTVLDKLYAGSLQWFAAALYDGGTISPEAVEELEAYLRTLKQEG